MKNTLIEIDRQLDTTEEQISDLEDITVENNQNKTKKGK